MISFKNVIKYFDNEQLFIINKLDLYNGIYVIKGENGVGKSTFLDLISYRTSYEGEVILGDIKKDDIVFVSQKIMLLDKLSVKENLEIFLNYNQIKKSKNLADSLGLNIYDKKKVSKLSGGQKQKLQLLVGLIKDSKVLILDEFDNNLDINSINVIKSELKKKECEYIFIVSHDEDFLMDIVNYEIVICDKKVKLKEILNGDNKKLNDVSNKSFLSIKDIKNLRKYNLVSYLLLFLLMFFSFLIIKNIIFLSTNQLLSVSNVNLLPFSDNFSVVTAPRYSIAYQKIGDESWLKDMEYGFKKEDIDKLNDLDFVESVRVIAPEVYSIQEGTILYNNKNIGLDIEKNNIIDYSNINYNKLEKYLKDNKIEFDVKKYSNKEISFSSLKYPKEVFLNTPLFDGSVSNNYILKGSIPNDQSNEIAIDMYTALYLSKLYDISIDNIIGKDIEVPLSIYDSSTRINKVGENNFNFKISGIYISNVPGVVYYSYHKDSNVTKINECSDVEGEENIISCKSTYASNPLNVNKIDENYYKELLDKDLKKDYGVAMSLYIKTKGSYGEKKLMEYFNNISPYIQVENNYTRIHNSNSKGLFLFVIKSLVSLLVSISIFISVVIFIYKIIKYNIDKKIKNKLSYNNIKSVEIKKVYKDQKKIILLFSFICSLLFLILFLIKVKFIFSIYFIVLLIVLLIINLLLFLVFKLFK